MMADRPVSYDSWGRVLSAIPVNSERMTVTSDLIGYSVIHGASVSLDYKPTYVPNIRELATSEVTFSVQAPRRLDSNKIHVTDRHRVANIIRNQTAALLFRIWARWHLGLII